MIRKKVQIHCFFYIFMVIVVMTGYFKDFLYFMILILIHEIGHLLMAIHYKWRIEKIVILPFGGLTIFHESLNRPLKEELFITLAGPGMQIIGYYILKHWIYDPTFSYYHIFLLFFNLMPILPLDGSKLFYILENYFFSFYHSQLITLFCSFFFLFLFFFVCISFPFNFMLYFCFFFLCLEWIKAYRKKNFVFHKFLLERYQTYYPFSKYRTIYFGNTKEMHRDYRHIFYIGKKSYTEREFLRRMFDFRRKL